MCICTGIAREIILLTFRQVTTLSAVICGWQLCASARAGLHHRHQRDIWWWCRAAQLATLSVTAGQIVAVDLPMDVPEHWALLAEAGNL